MYSKHVLAPMLIPQKEERQRPVMMGHRVTKWKVGEVNSHTKIVFHLIENIVGHNFTVIYIRNKCMARRLPSLIMINHQEAYDLLMESEYKIFNPLLPSMP